MTREEAIRFMRGEGCPTCEYGKKIPKWRDNETQDEKYINNGNKNNNGE
jgi:Zn ribbon nucleic-acid-binding protein